MSELWKENVRREASKAVSRSAMWLTAVSARLVVGLDWVLWLGPLCPCVKEIDKNYTSCHFQTPLKSSVCEHPYVFICFVFYILSLHFPGALAPLSESVCVCMYHSLLSVLKMSVVSVLCPPAHKVAEGAARLIYSLICMLAAQAARGDGGL